MKEGVMALTQKKTCCIPGQIVPENLVALYNGFAVVGRDVPQRDLNRLEKWFHASLMKFKKVPAHGLWDKPSSRHKRRLDEVWIETSHKEKHLGILVDKKLNLTQPCVLTAQKANYVLGCIKEGQSAGQKQVILPFSFTLVTPQHRKDTDMVDQVQRSTTTVRKD
ncbi:hypothetical protein WISP_145366 [Willisornis vidua]|uniref:Rna-directed dna polymerase from mobile element jockey-like n=1 Tax=Willisornis vidua TaxID=1566151 RepID=A0ABQ9CQC1_9PASS|nr:hypothetical protein WISP_145366 [Willisornis vidua]